MKRLGIALGALAGVVVAMFVLVGLEMLIVDESSGHAFDPSRKHPTRG